MNDFQQNQVSKALTSCGTPQNFGIAAISLLNSIMGLAGGDSDGSPSANTPALSALLTANSNTPENAVSLSIIFSEDFEGTFGGQAVQADLYPVISFTAAPGCVLDQVAIVRTAGSYQVASTIR